MAEHIDFHRDTEGSLDQNEDFWAVTVDDDGKVGVEHSWHHMNPYNSKVTSEGKKAYSLEEFRGSKDGARLKEKLNAALKKAGLDA